MQHKLCHHCNIELWEDTADPQKCGTWSGWSLLDGRFMDYDLDAYIYPCCNCAKKHRGWTQGMYDKDGCRHCKARAGWKDPAAKAAEDKAHAADIAAAVAKALAEAPAMVAMAAAEKAAAEKTAAEEAAAVKVEAEIAARNQAAAKAASAAAKQMRRDKASNLEAWLCDMCEIDDDEEMMEVLDAFVDPRYRVTSTPKLFSLNAEDMDTILAPLSLGTRKLIKNAWNEMRLHE